MKLLEAIIICAIIFFDILAVAIGILLAQFIGKTIFKIDLFKLFEKWFFEFNDFLEQ